MAQMIELSPRLRGILETSESGRNYLREHDMTLLESLYPQNILGTLWRNKWRILGLGALASFGHSAGLWARLAPHAARFNMGWLANAVDTGGRWFGQGAHYAWGHLRNLWTTLTGDRLVPMGVEGTHTVLTHLARNQVNRIPPAPPTP